MWSSKWCQWVPEQTSLHLPTLDFKNTKRKVCSWNSNVCFITQWEDKGFSPYFINSAAFFFSFDFGGTAIIPWCVQNYWLLITSIQLHFTYIQLHFTMSGWKLHNRNKDKRCNNNATESFHAVNEHNEAHHMVIKEPSSWHLPLCQRIVTQLFSCGLFGFYAQ